MQTNGITIIIAAKKNRFQVFGKTADCVFGVRSFRCKLDAKAYAFAMFAKLS